MNTQRLNRRINRISLLAIMMVAGLATIAAAHPGHDLNLDHEPAAFSGGLSHPVTGLDHLLAMVAVGLLAAGQSARNGGRWLWALPAMFLAAMVGGAALGTAGLFVPSWLAEGGIATSVVAFGVLIAVGRPLPMAIVLPLTALFALCHGSAHAAEMPEYASVAAYFAGFAISTAVLHAAGIGLGLGVARAATDRRPAAFARGCGVVMSVCGALMLTGVL